SSRQARTSSSVASRALIPPSCPIDDGLPARSEHRSLAAVLPATVCANKRRVTASPVVIDEIAKEYLHDDLRWIREALLWKLDGLTEIDVRRPLTSTGTNLLGLVKHLTASEARYFGEVFDRPFPEVLPPWYDPGAWDTLWATEHETRAQIIRGYRRAWEHS